MPKSAGTVLRWSPDDRAYVIYIDGLRRQSFAPDDTVSWWRWLDTCTTLSFQGQQGHLNLRKEARARGDGYWYAYAYTNQQKLKCYLGITSNMTFPRLEEIALQVSLPADATAIPISPEGASVPGISASSGDAGALLLEAPLKSKLSPPRVPKYLVARDRLLDMLDGVFSHRFVLLSASAGNGKTTLLATWAARALAFARPVAWLALDDMDNHPTRFWVSLIQSLRVCWPDIGENALQMLHSPQPPQPAIILTALLRDLIGRGEEITLILDDYHVIKDPAIHSALLFLLTHAPDHVHLILASRVDPPLAIARFRARGQLLELRDADLRFHPTETSQFLTTTMGLALSTDEVALLEQRTEGWIAGLQLAALALQRHPDRSAFVHDFSGNQRYLFDYIQEEIVEHLDVPTQDFLLNTAVLTRLHADLCQAVMETLDRSSCQKMLERIERANLFLVPLDEERGWYRFHDLFREALLARLRATQPARLSHLHRLAANWYEQQGEAREAIAHLLAAEDFDAAVILMERVVEAMWLQGESHTLYQWVMALPLDGIREHARFALTATWFLINASAHAADAQVSIACKQASRMMARIEAATFPTELPATHDQHVTLPESQYALLRQRLQQLRLYSGAMEAERKDDWPHLARLHQQLQQVSQEEDEIIWQMIPLSSAFADNVTLQQNGAYLVPRLLKAKQQAEQAGNWFALIRVKQWLALAFSQAGQLRQSYHQSLEALDLIEQAQGYALLAGYFLSCQASALYYWNRLDEARVIVHKMLENAALWHQIDQLRWGRVMLVDIEVAAKDMPAATQALQEAERLVQQRTHYLPWCMGVRVRWWLAQGNLTEARNWAERIVSNLDTWGQLGYMAYAPVIRVFCAQRQWVRAREVLHQFQSALQGTENSAYFILYLASAFVTLHQCGDLAQARAFAARLLALTEPEGHLRVYLDEGLPMQQALQETLNTSQDDGAEAPPLPLAYMRRVLAVFDQQDELYREVPPPDHEQGVQHSTHHISPGIALMEPLSAREWEVLHLLANGASNQTIADTLVISLSTTKKHVGKILLKLGATNRTQAIARAREQALL